MNQPEFFGGSASLVRNAPRRMLEKDLNTINGAPNKWSPMICCVKVPVVLHLLWVLGFGGDKRDRTADLLNAIGFREVT